MAVRTVAAVAGGLLLAAAFPPVGSAWLAPVAVAVLTLCQRGVRLRTGLGLGLLAGVVFFAALMRWMTVIGTDAWLMLAVYCTPWMGLLGLMTTLLQRGTRAWPVWVALAWVLQEALRSRFPLGGFPWGRLAFAEADSVLTPYAALGGTPLVTFVTALIGTGLAALVLLARDGRLRAALAVTAGLLLLLVGGLVVPLPVQGETRDGPAWTVAAVVQGSVPQLGMGAMDARRAVLDNNARQTVDLGEQVAGGRVAQPDLVIWPENASDLDPYTVPEAHAIIDAAVRTVNAPTLVGTVVPAPGDPTRVVNVGIVWDPVTGPGEWYVKRHPVPFGEYVPFRDVLARIVSRFDRVPRDFAPGDRPGVLQVGPARIGDVICFEVAYDDIVRDAVLAGGRALVVQTNNATYGLTGQPEQQLAMSRLRAVEHGRSVLIASTSGISAIIAPDGTTVALLPELVAGSLVADVALRDSLTLADRLGPWPEVLACLAVLATCAVVWQRRRVGSGPGTTGVPGRGDPLSEEGEPA